MIRTTAHDLRGNWVRVDPHQLLQRIKDDRYSRDDEWVITPWQRDPFGSKSRSYLAHSMGGSIYAIIIRKTPTTRSTSPRRSTAPSSPASWAAHSTSGRLSSPS